MVEYPKQVFCVWGGNQSSLSATCELQHPKETGAVPPLELHEGNLSRFTLTLLDTATGTTIPFIANLPATDIPGIVKKTDVALLKKEEFVPAGNEEMPACYTLELRFGKYKGRTIADVLLSETDAEAELNKIKSLLTTNLNKYPKNKIQINAIEEAFMLRDVGELKEQTQTPVKNKMEVYDRKYKSTRRKNAKGLFMCYNINISCQFEMDYPWLVTIENYYAPSENGKIDHKKASDFKRASIRIGDDDWALCLDRFRNLKNMYELMCFPNLYKLANEMAIQQAVEAKAKKEQAQ